LKALQHHRFALTMVDGDGSNSSNEEESDQGKQSPLPGSIVITQAAFEAHLRGVAFASWGELLRALPEEEEDDDSSYRVPRGESESIVKIDPMHIFSWAATFCIQLSLWGCVYLATSENIYYGIAATVLYGIVLWLVITKFVSASMAGMLWPNLPCAVAVAGMLIGIAATGTNKLQEMDITDSAKVVLFSCVIPQTLSAMYWMLDLPKDPDRAVLVCNVFLGVWAMIPLVAAIFGQDPGWRFTNWTLLGSGFCISGVAVRLFVVPGRWGSEELVSWTLNVGVLSVFVGTANILMDQLMNDNLVAWLLFALAIAAIGVVGRALSRTTPMLLSMIGIIVIALRISFAASFATGNVLAFFLVSGVLGFAIILFAHRCCQHSSSRSQAAWSQLFGEGGVPTAAAAAAAEKLNP